MGYAIQPLGIEHESISTSIGVCFTYFYTFIYFNNQYNISSFIHGYNLQINV